MKHYLVMCKDDQQWLDWTEMAEYGVSGSLVYTFEPRESSYILHDTRNPDDSMVYIKVTPQTVDNYIPSYLLFKEQIWLCDEEEFV